MYKAKPIIYLYPKKTEEITIKLGYPEKITCSYPKYKDEWSVIANPDGSLKDIKTGNENFCKYLQINDENEAGIVYLWLKKR